MAVEANLGNFLSYRIRGVDGTPTRGRTSLEGGGQAFPIVPLFYQLIQCKKLDENVIQPQMEQLNADLAAHLKDFQDVLARANALRDKVNDQNALDAELRKKIEDAKGEGTIFHVIGIIALVFFLIDLIVWMLALTRIRKVEQQVDQFKHEPDTPRMTGEK